MKIPLARVELRDGDYRAVDEVLRSGWIMQGPRVEAFEKAVAGACQTPLAVAVSSGTTALHLALLLLGVRPDDEVIVPSFTWIACANAVRYCGAKPVFCDVDPKTFNMDPEDAARRVTPRTRAIMVVHQFGMPCPMEPFAALAARHGIELVEDAACAIGSLYRGAPVGSGGHSRATCLSFHPRKVVTTGEGGMLLLKEPALAERARLLRNHGIPAGGSGDVFQEIGYNYRLTDMQAALGLGQIARLPETIRQRRALAARYHERLRRCEGVLPPFEPADCASNFQSYMIRLPGCSHSARDQIAAELAAAGIATRKAIAPIHQQPCYTTKAAGVKLKETDALAAEGLILPLFSGMTTEEIDFVCDTLQTAIQRSGWISTTTKR